MIATRIGAARPDVPLPILSQYEKVRCTLPEGIGSLALDLEFVDGRWCYVRRCLAVSDGQLKIARLSPFGTPLYTQHLPCPEVLDSLLRKSAGACGDCAAGLFVHWGLDGPNPFIESFILEMTTAAGVESTVAIRHTVANHPFFVAMQDDLSDDLEELAAAELVSASCS